MTQGVLGLLIDDPEQAAFLGAIPLLVLFFFWANRTFLPWLAALIVCLSTLLRPYQALLVGVAAILGTAMAGWVTRFSERLAPLRWVLPGEYGGLLLSHRVTEQLVGAGVFLGVAMVFVSLAVITLERRDV